VAVHTPYTATLVQVAADLLCDDHLLNPLQQIFGLSEVEPERLGAQIVTFDVGHLVHGRWLVVVGFNNDLHAYPHTVCPTEAIAGSARCRLTTRRSNRSISNQSSNSWTSAEWSSTNAS
jgi:hypothetical protein